MSFRGSPPSSPRSTTLLQGFWHGPPLGPLRRACLESFCSLGYEFHLYVYGPVDVPGGIILRDAAEIIPFQELFYYDNPESEAKDLGPFSDLFRFKLLSERGGWWIDVDTICLSPAIPSVDRAWAQQLPEVNSGAIGTGQLALARGDPLAIELYTRCLAKSRTNFRPREVLGPRLLSSVILEWGLPPNVFGRPETFYPLRFIEMFKLWLPEFCNEVEEKARDALFMPVFQSFPQYIGLDFVRLPPAHSYLWKFCRRYGDFTNRLCYDDEDVRRGTRAYFERNSRWAIRELTTVCGDSAVAELGIRARSA